MMRRGAAFLATLVSLVGPVRAADIAPSSWKYENPFCKVVANVMPVTGRAAYAVAVYTASGTLIDAHVTLVGETDAFDAHVVSAPLSGPADNRQSAPILVTLPTGQSASYFFVDSYSIDNAQPVTCPSYVFSAGARTVDEPVDAPVMAAQHLQALGLLKCGRVYTAPGKRGELEAPVAAFNGRTLTVVVRAYLDSNGYSMREDVVRSSGVQWMDQFTIGAVHVHQFAPAQFLCTPVVGTLDLEMQYGP
jgi:hypothetical protein